MNDTSAPKNESATDWQGILSAAADLHEALAFLRPALAKAARNGDLKYREIGEPLRVSTNRAWTLINDEAPSASLESAE